MLKVYACITTAHDPWLVGFAAVICAMASYAAINLLRHACSSVGPMRGVWLAVSAISTGFGIWATHFIAMLAFSPGVPSGYDVKLIFLSLFTAILLTGAGLAVSLRHHWRFGPPLGGMIVAGGIAAMHYTGMAAFEVAGNLLWDPALIIASVAVAMLLGAVALPVGLHARSEKSKAFGALLLTLAICGHHFTAMGAISIIPDPTVEISRSALPAEWLAGVVGTASLMIILLALAGIALDLRERRRMEIEADRMRGLANGAIEGLLDCDDDLHSAKTEGLTAYRFFEAEMGVEARERRLIEHDLRHAIERNEMSLVYQPQQDIRSGAITGFEALLRWKHPTRGDISPLIFIPIAEDTGAILKIGDWVLKSACYQAAGWTQPFAVAVNVSAVQLYNADFVQDVHAILLQTGLPSRRLTIEITETALVRDFNRALATLRRIKALGVSIAMDDFGTGYSSLSSLRAFPFDKIKIDRSFITAVDSNQQAATIVRAVLGIGRGLDLPVLAEGVETDEQLQFLQNEFCDEIQGYLFGRPAPIETFRSLIHDDGTELWAEDGLAPSTQTAKNP